MITFIQFELGHLQGHPKWKWLSENVRFGEQPWSFQAEGNAEFNEQLFSEKKHIFQGSGILVIFH